LSSQPSLLTADAVAKLAAERDVDIILASHSPAFLNVAYPGVRYYGIRRTAEGRSEIRSLSEHDWQRLQDDLEMFGLSRADLLILHRGARIVEGHHDKLILERLLGRELATRRLIVLPLMGAHEAVALIDAHLLRSLDMRLYVMLDSTRTITLEQLRAGRRLPRDASLEERQLAKLVDLWKETPPPQLVPFEAPDIICALPEEAVERVLPGRFPGWTPIIDAYNQRKEARGFKPFFFDQMGLAAGRHTVWIKRVLAQLDEEIDVRPPAWLWRELYKALEVSELPPA